VSVFELLSSGAVAKVAAYLQGADLPATAPDRDEQLLQRLSGFAQVC
jgi:hypothetical protein